MNINETPVNWPAAPIFAPWFQDLLEKGLSMVPGEMDPELFEEKAYQGYISYGLSMTDGYYAPEDKEAWLVGFRKDPAGSLYYGNDARSVLAPYAAAYKGWVACLDDEVDAGSEGLEDMDQAIVEDRSEGFVSHPPVWPNYIDNPEPLEEGYSTTGQGAPDEVLNEASGLKAAIAELDPEGILVATGNVTGEWFEYSSPKGLIWFRASDNSIGLEMSISPKN